MTDENPSEHAQVERVIDRLAAKFPHLHRTHIVEVVQGEHQALEGRPIRDYVPVLVEHAAKDRLRAEMRSTETVS